ncbi:hypothetical protein PG995_005508 [Apiospora arundinis]
MDPVVSDKPPHHDPHMGTVPWAADDQVRLPTTREPGRAIFNSHAIWRRKMRLKTPQKGPNFCLLHREDHFGADR